MFFTQLWTVFSLSARRWAIGSGLQPWIIRFSRVGEFARSRRRGPGALAARGIDSLGTSRASPLLNPGHRQRHRRGASAWKTNLGKGPACLTMAGIEGKCSTQ